MAEEAGAEKASYALKLLQSEGELTIASTGKDPETGKMVTQEYHVEGPVMIFCLRSLIVFGQGPGQSRPRLAPASAAAFPGQTTSLANPRGTPGRGAGALGRTQPRAASALSVLPHPDGAAGDLASGPAGALAGAASSPTNPILPPIWLGRKMSPLIHRCGLPGRGSKAPMTDEPSGPWRERRGGVSWMG